MPVLSVDVIDIVKEFKQILKSIHKDNLHAVILFGSMARGDFDEESDIDVLVILNDISDYKKEFDKTFQAQRELEMRYDDSIIISCIIAKYLDYESKYEPLYLSIRKDGIVI